MTTFKNIFSQGSKNKPGNKYANKLTVVLSGCINSSNFYSFLTTFFAFSYFLTRTHLKKIGKETIDAVLRAN